MGAKVAVFVLLVVTGGCLSFGAENQTPDAAAVDAAGIDAAELDFDDHLQPYDCDVDTQMLLHLDGDVDDACARSAVTAVTMPDFSPGVFSLGGNFNRGGQSMDFAFAATDGLVAANEYTVDVWIAQPSIPSAATLAVVASRARFTGDAIDDGRFILSVDGERRVRLDLFGGALCNVALSPIVSERQIDVLDATHIRASVTATEAELYINGRLDRAETVGTPCTDLTTGELRLAAIRNPPDESETSTYRRFSGLIDELRISRVAR